MKVKDFIELVEALKVHNPQIMDYDLGYFNHSVKLPDDGDFESADQWEVCRGRHQLMLV